VKTIERCSVTILDYEKIPADVLKKAALGVSSENSLAEVARHPSRERGFHAGRAAIYALGQSLQLPLSVAANPEWGYPFLEKREQLPDNLRISISHTDSIAVAALSPAQVGIDIEPMERHANKVISRLLSRDELSSLPEFFLVENQKVSGALIAWSAKESYSKALGVGIRETIRDLQIDFSSGFPLKAKTTSSSPFAMSSARIECSIYRRYLITLCTEEKTLSLGTDRRVIESFSF
jgi:phosphopantetheinyl transferase